MNSLPSRPHRSWSPHLRRATWCFLLLTCILATAPVAVQGQVVPLTLNESNANGTLPEGAEVLVYYEEGRKATPLSAWRSRSAMGNTLAQQADSNFENVFDRLTAEGVTDKITVPTEPPHFAYVLSRIETTPESSEEATYRFYESQVGGTEVEPGAGLDVVETGNMNMAPVSEANESWAAATFERALHTPLTLQGISTSKDAKIHVWMRSAEDSTAFSRAALGTIEDEEYTLAAEGKTEQRFERTGYSGEEVYVAVQTRNAEGEPVWHESVWGDGGFGAITNGEVQMQPVPERHQVTMRDLFPQDSGNNWFSLTFYGLVGGLLLVVLLLGGRAFMKEPKRKNRRRQKSKMQRFWGAVMPGGDNNPNGEQSPDQEIVEGRRGKKENASRRKIKELRSKLETKNNKIESLETKLRRKEQQLKEQRDRNKQKSQRNRTASQSKHQPKPPSTAEKVGKAFKKWCTEGSPAMVDRHHLFGRQIESEISSASFRRIKRENNAAGLVFDDNAQDPVEYWLVEAGGTAYLLPQPTRNGFRELGECFGGQNVSPSQVSTVRPAKLKKRSSGFALQEKGHIE